MSATQEVLAQLNPKMQDRLLSGNSDIQYERQPLPSHTRALNGGAALW